MERTEAAYGRLDGLVNNAGVSEIETVEETSLESWQFVNDVNSRGTFLGCKHAIPIMKKSGGGSIINISSMAALACYPQYFSYVASKAAVHAMTKSIAVHCLKSANNIRCNSVYPGAINTPLQRAVQVVQDDVEESALSKNNLPVGEPDDIAKLVLYLISDDSRFMNGAELRIDGGGLYL
jgi:3(or 17)beta-hydroxysteroid dehydrogenase